ncbi:hypothetical protein Y032_0080g1327 [Ancylostoma ceylanicum]|uniref:Uncharacterized protein n=1 Tax=Ancylostoma ceylanicum TaxID=53326 RepID=A0A016TTI4_9BILA|nr:hypothetical protein Y032_0080g1327 [Ancylostoma ceylanicum]
MNNNVMIVWKRYDNSPSTVRYVTVRLLINCWTPDHYLHPIQGFGQQVGFQQVTNQIGNNSEPRQSRRQPFSGTVGFFICRLKPLTSISNDTRSELLRMVRLQGTHASWRLPRVNVSTPHKFTYEAMVPSEVNQILIILTVVVASTALVLMLYIYCHYKCGFCHRQQKRSNAELPEVRITMHNDAKMPLSVDCPDIDFIDSRNTNLISSTVRVSSVHNTPHQL